MLQGIIFTSRVPFGTEREKTMKIKIKKILSIVLSIAMVSAMLQVTAGAEVATDYDFSDASQTVTLANGGKIGDYTAVAAQEEGKSGKDADDKVYTATAAALPYSQAGSVSFEIPYYAFVVGTQKAVKTLEISVKYNENSDETKLSSYIARGSDWNSSKAMVNWVTFRDGKVYVADSDTGITATPNEWYRIVVKECYNAPDTRVYVNGKEFNPGISGKILGNRWTQLMANVNASETTGTRDVSISIDDMKIYDTEPSPETIEYTVSGDGITYIAARKGVFVSENTEVSAVLGAINTTAEKYIIDSLTSNTKKESGTVSEGDVVVLRSADKKTIEYLYVYTSSPVTVKTDYDFSDAAHIVNLANGGKIGDITIQRAQTDGTAGKETSDKTYTATASNIPNTTAGVVSFQPNYYDNVACHPGGDNIPVRTMEVSLKYDENAAWTMIQSRISAEADNWNRDVVTAPEWVKFENGKIYVVGKDTGLVAKPNEWYRIAIEEHYNAADTRIYINGKEFNPGMEKYILGNMWTQIMSHIDKSEAADARNLSLSIDDLKIYDGTYTPNTVEYTISGDGITYMAARKGLLVSGNKTVDDILSAVNTTAEKYMIDSLASNTKKESGTVSNGNVVILKSADKKTIEYLYVYTGREDMIVDQDSFKESSTYTMFGETKYAGNGVATGIYGKAANDYSYDLKVTNLPKETESANRYNFVPDNNLCDAEAFTREFSISGEGDFDVIKLVTRSYFTDSDGNSVLAYQEPLKLLADGDIEAGGRVLIDTMFKEKQWYRVAMTVYPKQLRYDLYINGVKVVEHTETGDYGWLSTEKDHCVPEKYNITSFAWFNIQPVYNADNSAESRNGHVYIDDTISYYGAYYEDAENDVEISSTEYKIDDYEGTITVPADTTIDSFAVNMDFGTSLPVIYTDNTYTAEVEDTLSDGNVLIAASENGLVRKYYTVKTEKTDAFRCENIKTYVNGVESNTLAVGTIKATVSMFVPSEMGEKAGSLIIAIYKNGVLQSAKMDEKKATGKLDFTITTNIEETEGVTVKAFFWDDNIKPYVPFAKCR